MTDRRTVLAMLMAPVVLGALCGWLTHSKPRTDTVPATGADAPDLTQVRTAADRMSGGGGGHETRAEKESESRLWGPRALPDSLFEPKHKKGGHLFVQIVSTLEAPSVRFRALGTRDGSFLFDQEKGWLRFTGSVFAPIRENDVPGAIRSLYPQQGEKH